MIRITKKSERQDADIVRRVCIRVRTRLELTQAELARKVGVNLAMIQRVEQGTQHTFPRGLYESLMNMVEEPPSP